MRRFGVTASAPFVLFSALVFFLDGTGLVSAAVPAVIAHEAGHALALRLFGCRARRLSMRVSGFSLDYTGFLSRAGETISALAGPLAGFLFAAAAYFAGKGADSRFLLCSADISLLLSLFNLMPALPLDGGRALRCLVGERAAQAVSAACACFISLLGLLLFSRGYGIALIAAGFLLNIYSCKSAGFDVK